MTMTFLYFPLVFIHFSSLLPHKCLSPAHCSVAAILVKAEQASFVPERFEKVLHLFRGKVGNLTQVIAKVLPKLLTVYIIPTYIRNNTNL